MAGNRHLFYAWAAVGADAILLPRCTSRLDVVYPQRLAFDLRDLENVRLTTEVHGDRVASGPRGGSLGQFQDDRAAIPFSLRRAAPKNRRTKLQSSRALRPS